MSQRARARANANIALAKYWGKSDTELNLPAVPSLSLTLDPLTTETLVSFEPGLDEDTFVLDGAPAGAGELGRVTRLLDEVRALGDTSLRARVESVNHFPTAAGLASSASGFAALAGAAAAALGLDLGDDALSAMARRASASAARSIYGGFVTLAAGEPGDDSLAARPLAPEDHWDLRVIVATTAKGRKPIGSRDAMAESRRSSPLYAAWVEQSPALYAHVEAAVRARDLEALVDPLEQSFLAMHAVAMTSAPSVLYWQPASVAVLHAVRALRQEGVLAAATMDAGPHVKVFCLAADADQVEAALREVPGVVGTLRATPGGGLEVEAVS